MLGLDLLGLGSKYWKINETLAVFPEGWALGCFAREFGDALPNVRKLLATGKVPALRVQVWWSAQHKIAPLSFLKEELPRWEGLAKEFPGVKVYVSHSCEYSEKSKSEIEKRVALVKKLCPSCTPVSTPMHSPVGKGTLLEQHGTKAKPKAGGIVSTDGISAADIDITQWLKRHEASAIEFLWAPRFNLRESGDFIPPKERKAYPEKAYIKAVIRLGGIKTSMPAPSFSYQKLAKPELYKVFAEDSPGEGDKRGNRPLAILKDKTDFIEIVTHTGEVLGKFKYYDTYGPTLYRYYSGTKGSMGLYGYQIGNKAAKASGSEWVWIKQGKKFIGPICAPFRTPFFQTEH